MERIKRYFHAMQKDLFVSTTNRLCVQLKLFCIAAGFITVIMTVLNAAKGEWALGAETLIGALVSIGIYIHVSKTKKYQLGAISMAIAFLILITLFLVSGAVEGFAALWFCLYPFLCLFVMDIKPALFFNLLGLLILLVCLRTPLAQLLPPVYTQNFMLRFPLLYVGNFGFALALNGFYSYTYNRLLALNRKFEILSNQDGLTKLANRTYLEQYEADLVRSGALELYAIMLDVDCFKQYNDTYGHLAGDAVLKSIAEQMTALLPPEYALASRYGGEEFLVLLHRCDKACAMQLAEALRSAVQALRIPHSASACGYVTISLGVGGRHVACHEEFLSLLGQADNAMYCAKQHGRNCIETQ